MVGLAEVRLAWPIEPIDADAFIDRLAHWLADAAQRRLQTPLHDAGEADAAELAPEVSRLNVRPAALTIRQASVQAALIVIGRPDRRRLPAPTPRSSRLPSSAFRHRASQTRS